ncbi:MAG: Glu/Leu/Phe/Val dehydrogenase [Bacillota bacterium]|nr:Glu/Leu/Phe/Val dehydrogenase [Bacillota bacterium]
MIMGIFDEMAKGGHEQVMFLREPATGLKAVVAFHNTILGPGLGGTRMYPYAREEEALEDVLRLSKGMTYKAAAVDLDFGGAKCVIWGDPQKDKTPEMMRALGRFVEGLKGRFYTGTDVGTTPEDFAVAARESQYIVGLPKAYGGGGDSSVPTALGVFYGIQAVAQALWRTPDLKGRRVAIQGVGKVGAKLARHLHEAGAELLLSDVNEARAQKLAQELGAQYVSPDEILYQPCDILSPCALGGILHEESIPRLQCQAVAGSANNQLKEAEDGRRLQRRGILYAPDYIINAGGLIQVADELDPRGFHEERVLAKTKAIKESLLQIFALSKEKGISTAEAADRLVEEKLATIFALRKVQPF